MFHSNQFNFFFLVRLTSLSWCHLFFVLHIFFIFQWKISYLFCWTLFRQIIFKMFLTHIVPFFFSYECVYYCRTNAEKSLQNKKRVIQMLFVVVLEFFICWTPLYVINTIALFNPHIVYQTLGYTTITYFQLLAYSSSCCNPITYCFMNRGFRKAFLNLFRCFKRFHEPRRMSIGGGGGGVGGVGGAPSAAVIVGNGATQFSESEVHRFQTQRLCTDSSNWLTFTLVCK